MYKPLFNSVLVEIDDADSAWGSGNDESMLGKSFTKGKVVGLSAINYATDTHPIKDFSFVHKQLEGLANKQITWNEGAEAGTTFEEDGKLYGFVYWFDIRGVQE